MQNERLLWRHCEPAQRDCCRWALSTVLVLTFALTSPSGHAQSFPPQYANALQRAQYSVLVADVNGDGVQDLLLRPKKRWVMIDYDVPFPVPAKPASPLFVLLSGPGGQFTLNSAPSASLSSNPAWAVSTYQLSFGDSAGSGSVSMIIKSSVAGAASFLVTTSSANGQPVLTQTLSTATIGLDLGASNSAVTLQDVSRDGRADMVLRVGGFITAVLYAATDGSFTPPPLAIGGGALTAWRSFTASITLGDSGSAATLLSEDAYTNYGSALLALANTPIFSSIPHNWSNAEASIVANDYAELVVFQTESGQQVMHFVTLINANGRWLVESF